MTKDSGRFPEVYDYKSSQPGGAQHGEDGVLEYIFDKIGIKNKYFVDAGCFHPYNISNSYKWVHINKWNGLLIDANKKHVRRCRNHYKNRENVCVTRQTLSRKNTLDDVLNKMATTGFIVPFNYDVLSIDVDSIDYFLWKDHVKYRPRVLIVECNASIDHDVFYVQHPDDPIQVGNSALSLVELGKEKGYELAAHLYSNLVFVIKEEYPALGIRDNSLKRLFCSAWVPKVVSDIRGVHYLIKVGPWGYKKTRLECSTNKITDESKTLYKSLNDSNEEVVNSSSFKNLKICYDWDVKKDYKNWMLWNKI